MSTPKYYLDGEPVRHLLNERNYSTFIWYIKEKHMSVKEAYEASLNANRTIYKINGESAYKLLGDENRYKYFCNLIYRKNYSVEDAFKEASTNYVPSGKKPYTRKCINEKAPGTISQPIDVKLPYVDINSAPKKVENKKVKNKLYVENFTFSFKRSTLTDANLKSSFTKELMDKIYEVAKTILVNNSEQIQEIGYPILEKYEISEKE